MKGYNYIIFILFSLNIGILVQNCIPVTGDWRNILLASFISFVFYFMVVLIPNYFRKKILKDTFLHFYTQFKEDVLREILHLANFEGDIDTKVEELKDTDNFITFASSSSETEGQNNWHVLMNNIDKDDYTHAFKTIALKLSELQREADFLVRSVGVENEELLNNFRRLDRVLQDGRFKDELDWNWGEDERFTESLYELLSGRSMVDKDQGDFIRNWVKKL